ncbi:MAG: DinB family protein [Armatimonadetes bacterium]|nr:DinB family protein [Armatimonadota bacterium]
MTADDLAELLNRAFDKSPWHSVKGALEGLEYGTFVWLPERHAGFPWMNGSIRDILFHVTGDKLVQINHAFGDCSLDWKRMPLAKGDLAEMLPKLDDAQTQVLSALNGALDLGATIRAWGGKSMPAKDLFLMLIEHDIYHAGQIRYIRNIAPPR